MTVPAAFCAGSLTATACYILGCLIGRRLGRTTH